MCVCVCVKLQRKFYSIEMLVERVSLASASMGNKTRKMREKLKKKIYKISRHRKEERE